MDKRTKKPTKKKPTKRLPEKALTAIELAMIDALITTAQAKGRRQDGVLIKTEDIAHGIAEKIAGRVFSPRDQLVLKQIVDLGGTLEGGPTIDQLVNLRRQALTGR